MLRRSSATAAANARLDFTKIKQLGGWRSDSVAQGYIEKSSANREDIFKKIANVNQGKINHSNGIRKSTVTSLNRNESSSSKQEISKISDKINVNSHPPAVASTSAQNPNKIVDLIDSDFFTEDILIPVNDLLSPPAERRTLLQKFPSKKNDIDNHDVSEPKKKRSVVENDQENQVPHKSSAVIFQNSEIHQLVINNNYYYSHKNDETTE